MAAESVQIVLEGIDKASPAFASVSQSIKETGEQSQKLSGVFGQIFSALGLGQLSALTGQFQSLSGQMKELGDAGTKGGAGMLAAKAGIVAASVAAGFQVGTMISDWLNGTEEWNKKMLETLANAEKTAAKLNQKNQEQLSLQLKIANAAATEEQRVSELRDLSAKKAAEIAEAERNLAKENAELQKALANDFMGYGKEDNAAAETAVKLAKERLDLLRQQSAEIGKAIRGPTDDEAELERRIKAQEENKKAIEDARKADEQAWAKLAKQLQDEQKARDDQIKRDQSYLDNLKARNIELEKGKRAADEFRAALAGITEETIAAGREISIQNELLEAQQQLEEEQKRVDDERQQKLTAPTPELQAVQSRLLTRAPNSQADRAVKANEKVAELTQRIVSLQREQQSLLGQIASNTANPLQVVGR
jgi:hypothetical protein